MWAACGARLVAVLVEGGVLDPVEAVLCAPVPLDPGRPPPGAEPVRRAGSGSGGRPRWCASYGSRRLWCAGWWCG